MGISFFGTKKKSKKPAVDVPKPPEDLPLFPSPDELEQHSDDEGLFGADAKDEHSQDLNDNFHGNEEPAQEELAPMDLPEETGNFEHEAERAVDLQESEDFEDDEDYSNIYEDVHDGPKYLKLEVFSEVVNGTNEVKGKLDECAKLISSLESINDEQGRSLRKFSDQMKDTHAKLLLIDDIMFKRG